MARRSVRRLDPLTTFSTGVQGVAETRSPRDGVPAEDGGSTRRMTNLTRATLVLAVGLTFTAFLQLYVLTADTDRWFAWTIDEPLSAATLGAFYVASTVTVLLSLRHREWVLGRVSFPSVATFVWGTLLVTLLHVDKFHFSDGPTSARIAAWGWLVVYVVDPLLLTAVWIHQIRRPGTDPPRQQPLSTGYRGLLVGWGVASAVLGVSLFLRPTWVADWWPWAITPLTARAMAVWVLSLAVLFFTMLYENDADRTRPGSAASIVLAVLLVVGLLRYWDHASPDSARWLYLLAVLALGLVAVPDRFRVSRRGTDHSSGPHGEGRQD